MQVAEILRNMKSLAGAMLILFWATAGVQGQNAPVVEAVEAGTEVALATDPASPFWSAAPPAHLERDRQGAPMPGFRGEVRVRWTKHYLYFLFVCPYDELYLKPFPTTAAETNELWNWDVAEVFIGANFQDIRRYREFEVSPQGEWVDLDIDLNRPHHETGWTWNSGFEAKASIDAASHRWFAAMRIPLPAIDSRAAAAGNEFRINLFLSEGPPSNHRALAWQPPMSNTFHVPERFGRLRLVSGKD
jgi:hypothetical protein